MFTFGREHEKKCAIEYLRNKTDVELVSVSEMAQEKWRKK